MRAGSGCSSRRPAGREPPRAHLAGRPSPGSRGRARPPCPARPLAPGPLPPVTPPPRNGDHRAREQPPNPPGQLPAPGTDLRGPAGRGSAALGPGTAPGAPAGPALRRLRLLLAPRYSPGLCHGGASPEHDAFRSGNLSLPRYTAIC